MSLSVNKKWEGEANPTEDTIKDSLYILAQDYFCCEAEDILIQNLNVQNNQGEFTYSAYITRKVEDPPSPSDPPAPLPGTPEDLVNHFANGTGIFSEEYQ